LPLVEQVVDVGVEVAVVVDVDGPSVLPGVNDLSCVRVNDFSCVRSALPEADALAAEPAEVLLGPHGRESRNGLEGGRRRCLLAKSCVASTGDELVNVLVNFRGCDQ
jgi:hypothetical protein